MTSLKITWLKLPATSYSDIKFDLHLVSKSNYSFVKPVQYFCCEKQQNILTLTLLHAICCIEQDGSKLLLRLINHQETVSTMIYINPIEMMLNAGALCNIQRERDPMVLSISYLKSSHSKRI